ncbi:MAG: hypothetical protein ABW043_15900 [Devosia sp.]|uniref:hypothetical protein n=1 Tax=Devosia sp. TaxID=1871048 RepID=UPI003393066C
MRSLITAILVTLLLVPVAFAQFNDGGQTVLLQHPEQGSHIIFMGPRGKTYLWYGGSTEVLEGRYYSGMQENTICFKYGADRYNPVTGLPAGRSECTARSDFSALLQQTIKGDVFDLAGRRAAPFALGRGGMTLETAARQAGISIPDLVINTEDLVVRPGGGGVNVEALCKMYPELKANPYTACAD